MDEQAKQAKADFLKYTKNHSLKVVVDDGVNRHITFNHNDEIEYAFTITTWRYHLCIGGDFGTYVFSRTEDMFRFFRGRTDIHPCYWGEKLVSNSTFRGHKEFSEEVFNTAVKDHFDYMIEDDEEYSEEDRAKLWEEIKEQVLDPFDETSAIDSLTNFTTDYDFDFIDLNASFDDYTISYLICLHAIVAIISKYDEYKADSLEKIAS
ncbi:hypothetical protein [Piscirickettsia litoralis]|uniref:DUF3786 domain-containing protein n=1 Tax=Piscirickettsia litoralis TaxID=1891921 RepID=A0ABX3A069_9GAMM|nr:hypothetical protein [Piscirickettsia litoralis]ODN41018.1 hypothetical protein BGC07_18475 [Piscirickettsia litoralis]